MVAIVSSATVLGVEAHPVRVEVHVARGLPSVTLVGLPDAAVREARERVRAALASSGHVLPAARVLIHLAPAEVRKEGPALDLAIALALLAADGRIPSDVAARTLALGELGLDGSVRPVRGAVAVGLMALEHGPRELLLPDRDAPSVAALGGLQATPVASLDEAVRCLRGTAPRRRPSPQPQSRSPQRSDAGTHPPDADLRDVRGQGPARLALEVAAAGGHALLMTGPPGSGKTMLARRLPGLLPDLARSERIEVTRIHSAAGESLGDAEDGLIRRPPFRAPHHATSRVALLGGGRRPRPGDVSLAHHGVLFLDELPEFPRQVLEALRQPLEEGQVTVDRAEARIRFPSEVHLVAARNPCPCGRYGDPRGGCRCSDPQRRRYEARVSGPILDRIDLHVTLSPLTPHDLVGSPGEASDVVAARVRDARAVAVRRQGRPNARLDVAGLSAACRLATSTKRRAAALAHDLGLSARGHARLLRVARTFADLSGAPSVEEVHLEAAATLRTPVHLEHG